MKIKEVVAKAIKDSRGNPTIEVSVNKQKASSPSGKSTGKYESRPYKSTLQSSINLINSKSFQSALIGLEINCFENLKKIESTVRKKTKVKDVKKFGANALFALECAILKALSKSEKKQLFEVINPKSKRLPIPVGNAIGGGLHTPSYRNPPTFQEFLIIPKEKTAKKNINLMNKIYQKLKFVAKSNMKNDEGAWQTSMSNEVILEGMYKFKSKVNLGLDIAASSFYSKGNYVYKNKTLSRKAQIYYINNLIKRYNLYYIEDPLNETDFKGFKRIQKKNLIVGDDLTATHIGRLKKAIKKKSINAMIIKQNQNGSLLELKKIFDICKKNKIKTILSHRSGETLDNALADLAVGFQADYIKTGISTKPREVKLKRLIEIENHL